jgi:acyl-CoA thioesterase-1
MRTGRSYLLKTPWTSIIRKVLSCFPLLFILASSNLNAAPIKILAYGDSLTAGYRLPKEEAYPAQLEKLLKKDGAQATVVNGGVSGDTSKQALDRVDWNLKQGPFQLAIVSIGANDGLRRLPVPAFEANLRALLKKLKDSGSKVLLMGMKLPLNFAADYRKAFEAVYTKLARETGVELMPFMLEGVALQSELNLEDGIHPNQKGHAIIAGRIRQRLKESKLLDTLR